MKINKNRIKRLSSREQLLADSIREPRGKKRLTTSKKLAKSGLLRKSMDKSKSDWGADGWLGPCPLDPAPDSILNSLHRSRALKDTGLPKSKSKRGYSEAEVKDILFERFGRWMRGQTIGALEDGSFAYYQCDVYRYVNGLPVID
jgi:hypothetical protein